MRKLLLATLLLVMCAAPAKALTFVCANCSTNLVQMLDRITSMEQLQNIIAQYKEDIQQTAAQLRMVQQNIEQYANMVQNTISLPQNVLKEIQNNLTQLATLSSRLRTVRGDAVAMANIFANLFPDQSFLADLAGKGPEAIEKATQEYEAAWNGWSKQVDQATEATFQLSGMQLDDLQKNPAKMQSYLNELLSTPEGQMQALQAGNQLTALQIQEARQLRELLATQAQSDIAASMKSEKESQVRQEVWRNMTKTDKLDNLQPKRDPF